jgi:outer membrane lipoprotein SlyB
MSRRILVAVAAVLLAASPLAASAQNTAPPPPANGPYGDQLLPSQSVITGVLEQSISSKTAEPGDPFVIDVQPPFPGDDGRFQAAKIYGHVAAVSRAGGLKKGSVALAFDRITLADGTTASLSGSVLSLDAKQQGSKGARAVIGAVIGDLVGNYIGKKLGTNVGGAVGAVGGAIYAANIGTNVTIGPGSTVEMRTTHPSTVLSRRQQYQAPPPAGTSGYAPGTFAAPTAYPTPYH